MNPEPRPIHIFPKSVDWSERVVHDGDALGQDLGLHPRQVDHLAGGRERFECLHERGQHAVRVRFPRPPDDSIRGNGDVRGRHLLDDGAAVDRGWIHGASGTAQARAW